MVTKPGSRTIGASANQVRAGSVSAPTITFAPSIAIFASRVDKLGMDISSFREPLKRAIKEVMVPSIRQNFIVGGRPPWESLSPLTEAIKLRQGAGLKILARKGTLERVAQQQNIWTVNETTAFVKDLPTRVWYGKVHQQGYGSGNTPTKKSLSDILREQREALKTGKTIKANSGPYIPQRPFLVIQPEDQTAIKRVFYKWLEERVARHWSKL